MACRGVFFSLDGEQTRRITAARNDEELMAVIEQVESAWDADHLAECDKSWDAMHRSLSDGTLNWNAGDYPLNQVVLGGPSLYKGRGYIVCLKDITCVRDIATAVRGIDRSLFEQWYDMKANDYAPEFGEDDCAD